MKFRAVHLACVWLLLGGRAGAALSSWDESQLGLLEQYPTPLRWDNVEGAPQWVAGAKPDHNLRRGLHLIHLHPGEEVTLRAAADTWLRLAGEGRTLRPEDLEISVSTDTRMFLEVVPLKTIDPYSLLIALPRDKPSLIRVTLPPQRASNCVFAAFFSRRELWPALAPHRGSLRLPGKEVRVQRDDEAFSHGACPLNAGEDLTLALEGPTRLQLEAILQWPLNDPTREQPLIIQAGLEGGDLFPLLLGSRLDNRHRTRVEGTNVLVSRRMEGFLNIPAGEHRLRLRTTAPIYLSVFQQDHPDFLLPRINGPAPNAIQLLHQALGNSLAPDSNLVSPLRSPAPFQEPPFSGSASALAVFEQEAWRLARDNQPLDAGAQAADWLDRLSQTRPDYPAARQTAESLWSLRTFYREILPSSMAPGQPLRKAFFSPGRILPASESGRRVAVQNPTLEETMGLFAEGHFVPVPPEFPPGLLYELPARSHDSRLRIAGIGSPATRTRVLVQFDQEAPLRVDLEPEKTLPAGELAPADAFATLRVLEQAAQLPTNASFGPPVGEFDLPLSVSEPGVAELALPRHVRRVHVYLPPGAAPVLVSVAYRAAEPFQLGEAGFLALLAQVDSLDVMRLLAQPGNLFEVTKSPFALDQLRNHWVPLTRLLNAHVSDFTRSVDLAPRWPGSDKVFTAEETCGLTNSAAVLEKEGKLIEAVEAWNRLFWHGQAGTQPEAALAIMRCLESLGEEFLAAQYARWLLLKAPVSQLPMPAVTLLEDLARQNQDPDQVEEVRAFLFQRCPCPRHLASLAEALILNGREELGLTAGLLVPPQSQPAESMLGAALRLNWWRTFDQLVEELPRRNAKHFWRAQKHLAFYRFGEAEQELKESYQHGREMFQALRKGARIREQLGGITPSERLEGILAWEQWQSHLPGPTTWRISNDVLQECSATDLLFNCEQNQFTGFLRSEPGKPVKLRFLGPLRLRLEARPILPVPFEKPVDDWIEVVEYGWTNRFPVSQSVPNPNLRFTPDRGVLAAVRTFTKLEFGPGWHEVAVSLAGQAGLIRVWQEEPVLPLRILPTLNAERVSRVLHGGVASSSGADDLQARKAIPPSEQWQAACRSNRWPDFTNWTALADTARVNACLAAGRIDELFKLELPQDPLQRLARLVEIAEHYPAWRETAQCLAESLTEGTNCPPGGRKLLARLTQDRAWIPLPVTPVSAGLRPIQVSSDLPQDPALRLRRALLPPAATNQFTLSSRSAFTAAMTLQNPARLEVRAELVGVGFSALTPLVVSLQIDAGEALPLALTPAALEARTNFTLLAGSHLVRMRIEDPAVNQLVRVSLSGRSKEGTNIFWARSLAEAAAERRFFHIATPGQPVRFSWNGPAVLRIDEWREGQFCSQVRFVGGGEQIVEIPAAPGSADSCYQVFVRTTETNQPKPRVVFNPREPDEVLPPKLHLRESTPPSGAHLTDYYRPGGQEDGTWTPGLLFVHRRPFEISDALDAVDNEFVEANVVYRKVNQDETLWFRTEGLARAHRPGDLTLGISERIEGRPRNLPFEWSWSGEAFAGTTGPDREDVQGSLYTQLEIKRRIQLNRKLDWVPYASLFAHYLSLDPETAAQYDYIDQDLYTLFREEHRWGGIFGNRLEYRPWLDTYLKAGLALKSNEDFGLDDWGMRFSWTQLAGAFRGEVAYQFQSFLEDSDRSSDAFRQGVSAGVYYEHWFSGRNRMEIGMQCRHDWPDASNSYFLALRWDLGNGRGYRDYSPDEMIFRDLRSRRIPPAYNNVLEADSPAVNRR